MGFARCCYYSVISVPLELVLLTVIGVGHFFGFTVCIVYLVYFALYMLLTEEYMIRLILDRYKSLIHMVCVSLRQLIAHINHQVGLRLWSLSGSVACTWITKRDLAAFKQDQVCQELNIVPSVLAVSRLSPIRTFLLWESHHGRNYLLGQEDY